MRYLHNINTYRSKRQILEELQVGAAQAEEKGDISHLTITFAVLLIKLSEEAHITTRNLVQLKRLVFILVILLMIMILPPIIRGLYEFVTENSFTWTWPWGLPDFSGMGDWLRDLWNQARDWFWSLWKDSR